MKKPKWASEQEIGDYIWANPHEFYLNDTEDSRLFREFEINGRRMDFVVFSRQPPHVRIIELKLTADIWSIDQCAKYVRLMKEKCLWWAAGRQGEALEVEGEVWARWIDDSVWNFARSANIVMSKIAVEKGMISAAIEPYPVLEKDLPQHISSLLDASAGGVWPE